MNRTRTATIPPATQADPDGSASLLAARRRSAELEPLIAADPSRFRILTGDRPTGPLHLGHYFGTLANRVRLQRPGVELFVARRRLPGAHRPRRRRPARRATSTASSPTTSPSGSTRHAATIFAHSAVPALNQLMLPFLSLVSRWPSCAATRRSRRRSPRPGSTAVSGLMFTYPVHQAADILFCKANLVPVGKDQLPHLELTRADRPPVQRALRPGAAFFPEPDALLSRGADAARHRRARR